MQKLGSVGISNPSQTTTRQQATFQARKGKASAQVASALTALIAQFTTGDQRRLLEMSHSGREYLRLNPTIEVYQQNLSHTLPSVRIRVHDLEERNTALAPGLEFNSKRARVVTRLAGEIPVTIEVKARSQSEINMITHVLDEILSQHVYRLYRGLITYRKENWQMTFPRQLVMEAWSEEDAVGAGGRDEQLYSENLSFKLGYDSAFVEDRVHLPITAINAGSDLPRCLSLVPLAVGDFKLGQQERILIKHSKPILAYYLSDPEAATLTLRESSTTYLDVIPLKTGPVTLTVKTGDAARVLDFTISV